MDKRIYPCRVCGRSLSYANMYIDDDGVLCARCKDDLERGMREARWFISGWIILLGIIAFLAYLLFCTTGCGDAWNVEDGSTCWCVQTRCYTWYDGSERCDCIEKECTAVEEEQV